MKWLRGLFFASFISVMIAMLLSFLPNVEWEKKKQDGANTDIEQPVFQLVKPIILEQEEVVSFLKSISLAYAYKKVNLEKQDFFIDIKVTKEQYNHESIYQDAYYLVRHTFMNTANINRLFLRFILIGDDHQSLVLYVTAVRDTKTLEALISPINLEEIQLFLTDNTEVVYGTGWSED